MVLKGAAHYSAMCVNCHLAPGIVDTEIRSGLYPRPPNLSKYQVDPKVAFWVTKHGIKMSGMAAWGVSHDDATIWSIVAFINRLPQMSQKQYREIVAKAQSDETMPSPSGHGHFHANSRTDGGTQPGVQEHHAHD